MANQYALPVKVELQKKKTKIIIEGNIIASNYYSIFTDLGKINFFGSDYVVKAIETFDENYYFTPSKNFEKYYTKNFEEISKLLFKLYPLFKYETKIIYNLVKDYGFYYTITSIKELGMFDFLWNKYHMNDGLKFLILNEFDQKSTLQIIDELYKYIKDTPIEPLVKNIRPRTIEELIDIEEILYEDVKNIEINKTIPFIRKDKFDWKRIMIRAGIYRQFLINIGIIANVGAEI